MIRLEEFISLLLISYFVGFFASQKPFSLINWLIDNNLLKDKSDWLHSYSDYIFLSVAFVIGVAITITSLIYLPNKDVIQILIAYSSFLVVFYSVIVKDYASTFRLRALPSIEFNFTEPDCHKTELGAGIPVYYIRFRVRNIGKSTLRNTEVILEKVLHNGDQVKTSLPLNLTWALTENQGDRGKVHIPQGMFRTLDFIKILEPMSTSHFAFELQTSSNPAQELLSKRFRALSEGIGVCAVIEPNTLSDVLPFGEYTFYLSVASDNSVPLFAKFKIKYEGVWTDDTTEMFGGKLTVSLLETGFNKSQIFD